MGLVISQSLAGDTVHVTLTGNLDENSDFGVLKVEGVKVLEVDLAGVARCNSMGIMKWSRFLKSISASRRIVLQRCSTYIVKQLSVYPALLENLEVEVGSFFVSYVCDGCDRNASVLVQAADVQDAASYQAPPLTCDCGLQMEIDGSERQFLFLNRRTPTSA